MSKIPSSLATAAGLLLLRFGPGMQAAEMNPHNEGPVPLPPASEWLTYNGGYDGQRFSPLTQINTDSVPGLNEVCRVPVGELGPFHTGPILVGNVMYLTTSHATIALNPSNCEILWKTLYTPEVSEPWTSNHGLAFWQGKLFRGTPDGRLLAYDAATGKELWKTVVGDGGAGELLSSAPLAWNGLVFTGLSGGDFAIKGRMLAFDVLSGRPVWQFNLIPQRGEPGNETWPGSSSERGGGGTWTSYALDPETQEVFVPVDNPAPSFDGAMRAGRNLYTDSLVVLDALTGKLKWYYQVRPNDAHDYGVTSAPMLYSLEESRKIVALGAKDGYVYGIDRRTHQLVFKTAVVTIKNILSPATPQGVDVCPGALGGIEWNGPAFDRQNRALVVGANDWCMRLKSRAQEYSRGTLYMRGAVEMLGTPSGTITSLDATNGHVRWQHRTRAGVVSAITPTAGGVVFAGDLAGTLYALRSSDGTVLKEFATGGALAGGIVTYTVANRQYVAVVSGNVSRATFGVVGIPTVIFYSLIPPKMSVGASVPSAPNSASSAAESSQSSPDQPGNTLAGAQRYRQICSGCHGASGEGAVGPKLKGIAARMDFERTVALIKTPASDRMPRVFPGALTQQDVSDVAAFIRTLQ